MASTVVLIGACTRAQRLQESTPASSITASSITATSITASSITAGSITGFRERWATQLRGELPQQIVPDQKGRPWLFVADKNAGLLVLSREGGSVAGRVDTRSFGGLDVMYLDQRGDLMVAALGDFFAPSSRAGLATIDVTNPTAPKVLGVWTSPAPQKGAAAVVIDAKASFAYLGMMSAGIAAFDISNPAAPKLASALALDPDFPRRSPSAVALPNARGLELGQGLLYVANDAGGLRVVDVANPASMKEVGRYINAGVTKQQAYNDIVIEGTMLYASVDYCGLEVVDISAPTAPRQVAWLNPWNCTDNSNLWLNSQGHANQLALDTSRRVMWVAAGDSELVAIDVADPRQPRLAASHGMPKNGRGTYGLGADDQTIYLAYITAIVPFQGTWAGIVAVEPTG